MLQPNCFSWSEELKQTNKQTKRHVLNEPSTVYLSLPVILKQSITYICIQSSVHSSGNTCTYIVTAVNQCVHVRYHLSIPYLTDSFKTYLYITVSEQHPDDAMTIWALALTKRMDEVDPTRAWVTKGLPYVRRNDSSIPYLGMAVYIMVDRG